MVQDCPRCGLVNPPSARRCDCGYDFQSQSVARSHLSEGELARQADARLPIIVPTGCISLVLLLVMSGTNGRGACLVIIAFMDAVLLGKLVGDGAWVYLTTFGASAIAFDITARRLLRCSWLDVKRGSQFIQLPVWVLGFFASLAGIVALLAAYT
ncbi:MAG: hypothetical protein JWO38_1938 [Gemmataceae bacterium]|nr:hypothetical protein [Gemmataceae bacterium]